MLLQFVDSYPTTTCKGLWTSVLHHWQAVSSLAMKVAVHSSQTAGAVTVSSGTSTKLVELNSQLIWGTVCERTSKLGEFNGQFGRRLR